MAPDPFFSRLWAGHRQFFGNAVRVIRRACVAETRVPTSPEVYHTPDSESHVRGENDSLPAMTGRKRPRPFSVPDWLAENRADLQIAFSTPCGVSVVGPSEEFLKGEAGKNLKGRVQLIFTSPPFPLNRKKKYDNLQGDEFKKWLAEYAQPLRDLLTPDGSIVIEMGNAWEPGKPVMSTLAIEALLEFKRSASLQLCQEFVWHNPAKLPTPAQWVTIDRIRVKDSFTRLWWLSPVEKPKADNRQVLKPYSPSMRSLLRTQKYNSGRRPSEHVINDTSFLTNNGGAIPPSVISVEHKDSDEDAAESVLVGSNTSTTDGYQKYCSAKGLEPHPARMPIDLANFFIKLCTDKGDLVLDPFAGSNTTGAAAEGLGREWVAIEANERYAVSGACRFLKIQDLKKLPRLPAK